MKSRVNFNIAEKERVKREEEESRKKQIAYEQQVSEKKVQLRKDFETFKANDIESNSNLEYDIRESEFKKELDRLVSLNEQKKQNLNKLIIQDKNNTIMNRSSSMESSSRMAATSHFNNFTNNQMNSQLQQTQSGFFATRNSLMSRQEMESQQGDRNLMKSTKYSRNGFSKSYYRSQSMQFMSFKSGSDPLKVQEHVEEIKQLITQSEQNIFNENERAEQIKNMNKELIQSINQYKEKVNHLKRMNEIADQRYKDIFHIELQANENKRIVSDNVDQAKEKISDIERMYQQYREKKLNISQSLKVENEQEEYFLTNVLIKIEESKNQIEQLEKEIAKLDLEKVKYEKREKESYFVGLYLWSFEEIERIFLKGQTDNIIQNYYEIENITDNPTLQTNLKINDQGVNQIHILDQGHTSVSCIYSPSGSQANLLNPSGLILSQNQSKRDLIDQNRQNVSPTKVNKNGISSSHISPMCQTPIRISKKSKKKQLRLLDNVEVNYLDDYEVEPPNFDRKEVLEKIHQFYYDHNENIEPTIKQIMEFYSDQMVKCLLLKNQCEEAIQQKKLYTFQLQNLEQEVKQIKEDNFFLSNQTAINLKEKDSQNQSAKSRLPNMKIMLEQSQSNKNVTHDKLQIVEDFLNQKISMDSGFISKIDNKTNKEQISTVNVEMFTDQNKETDNLESNSEKLQKFIFKCYLSLVEQVVRLCLMVPLIDFKIDQMQQKINTYFEFEYVPNTLLKSSSELFALATHGKSLEKEFQRINEMVIGTHSFQSVGYSFQKSPSSFYSNQNQGQYLVTQNSSQNVKDSQQINNGKSTFLALPNNSISQFNNVLTSQQSQQFGAQNGLKNIQFQKKGSQQHLSYLNLDDILGSNNQAQSQTEEQTTLLPPPISLFTDNNRQQSSLQLPIQRQSTQDKEREKIIDKISEEILKDKLAKYMLHEQFIKQFIAKSLDSYPEITNDEILESIKNEALQILNDKMSQIFKSFSNLYGQVNSYICATLLQLEEKNVEVRYPYFGSNHPPAMGGILSLPKNDFIIKSYMNAFEKQHKYRRSEDEDMLQKFARTSQTDKNNLIINSNNSSSNLSNNNNNVQQESNKKNAIYKFIHEIADLRKTMSRKIATPISTQSIFQNTFNHGNSSSSQNPNNANNNSMINLGNSNNNNNFVNNPNPLQKDNVGQNFTTINNSSNDHPQLNPPQNQNRPGSNNNDKQSQKYQEDDYIDEERKNLKIIERKEYEELKNRDIVEKERQLQEEKKKKIVYHRLISNAETDNSKQEKSAIKQFAQDSDILFKINRLENSSQDDFTNKFNEAIKQENNKMNSKLSKEFYKLEYSYLKSNAIYNLRREISLKDRKDLQKQDIHHKYYIPRQSSTTMNRTLKEFKLPQNITQDKNNNSMHALIKKRNNLSQTNLKNDISSNIGLEESNNVNFHHSLSANPTQRSKPNALKIINQQLEKGMKKQNNQESTLDQSNRLRNTLFTPKLQNSNKFSSTSTDDISRFLSMNNNQQNIQQQNLVSHFQNNSSLLVQNYPTSANSQYVPVHYKYLQQDWVQQFTPNHYQNNQQAINNLQNIYLQKGQNFIRKAFTSQSGQRNKSQKQQNNQ